MVDFDKIGRHIYEQRKYFRKLSQERKAEELGMYQADISNMEKVKKGKRDHRPQQAGYDRRIPGEFCLFYMLTAILLLRMSAASFLRYRNNPSGVLSR